MQWSAYDGDSLRIVQSKGKKSVWVKASQELREILDSLPKTSPNIFLNSKGQPWTLSGYDSSWQSAKKASGVSGVTFHDSRGTAITLAYIGGSSLREIALMSGQAYGFVDDVVGFLPGDSGARGAFKSLAMEAQLTFTEKTKGAITDREMGMFRAAVPNLGQQQ